MAKERTGEGRRRESRYTRRGQVFILAASGGFIVFEVLRQWLFPELKEWESRAVSIVFMVTVSSLAVFYLSRILGTQERATARILEQNLELSLAEASSQASEEHVRRLLEQTSAIPWEADPETWMFLYVGPQAVRVFGYPLEAWYEEGFWEQHLHPDDRERAVAFCAAALRGNERFELEYRMLSSKGEVVWLHDLFSVEFENGKPKTFQGFMLDITARKRADEELSERLTFEKLVSRLSASLIDLPNDQLDPTLDELLCQVGRFMGVDRCGVAQLVENKTEVRITHIWTAQERRTFPRKAQVRVDLSWFARRMIQGEHLSFNSLRDLPAEAKAELEYLERFGVRAGVVVPLTSAEGVIGLFSVQMVRAERSWSEEDLRRLQLVGEIIGNALLRQRSEATLRGLSGRLIQAQEDERTRIARELHDDVGQRLALLSLDLHKMGSSPGDPDQVYLRSAELVGRVNELSGDVQNVAYNLHPAQLEHLGLRPAVEGLCKGLIARHDLRIKLDLHELPELSDAVALCLYRITQEALQNVVKHSGADAARVELWEDEDAIILRISDTGSGFEPSSPPRGGFGLVSMRERLRLVDGQLTIESSPGTGTRLEIHVPTTPVDAG